MSDVIALYLNNLVEGRLCRVVQASRSDAECHCNYSTIAVGQL